MCGSRVLFRFMASRWSFRRSIRLPGGLRINLSRRGAGYSLGVPGVRFGKDATGRDYQAYSIPGTGLYSRTYSGGRTDAASNQGGSFWKWFGIGFILALLGSGNRKKGGGGCLVLLLAPVVILIGVLALVASIPVPILVVAGILLVVLLLSRGLEFEFERSQSTPIQNDLLVTQGVVAPAASPQVQGHPPVSNPEPLPVVPPGERYVLFSPDVMAQTGSHDYGGRDIADFLSRVDETVNSVYPTLKEALRPVRMASSARILLQMEFQNAIYSFGLDESNRLSNHAASLYADTLGRLNRRLAGATPETIQAISAEYLAAHRAELTGVPKKPEMIRHLQSWDSVHGTRVAAVLRNLLLEAAVLAAAQDGSVPDTKSRRIEAFAAAMDCSV